MGLENWGKKAKDILTGTGKAAALAASLNAAEAPMRTVATEATSVEMNNAAEAHPYHERKGEDFFQYKGFNPEILKDQDYMKTIEVFMYELGYIMKDELAKNPAVDKFGYKRFSKDLSAAEFTAIIMNSRFYKPGMRVTPPMGADQTLSVSFFQEKDGAPVTVSIYTRGAGTAGSKYSISHDNPLNAEIDPQSLATRPDARLNH